MSASSKLKAIAQTWPSDPFRPNMQLQNFFISLSSHPHLSPQAVRATEALRANELQKKVIAILKVYFTIMAHNNFLQYIPRNKILVSTLGETVKTCFSALTL